MYVTCVRLRTQPKIFQIFEFEKHQIFCFTEKNFSCSFHILENAYQKFHAVFFYLWNGMVEVFYTWQLYHKKFWSNRYVIRKPSDL